MFEKIKNVLNNKIIKLSIVIIILLIISIIFIIVYIDYIARSMNNQLDPYGLNSCKVPFDVDGNYNVVDFSCHIGDKETTIDKNNGLKVTFECINNINNMYNKQILLKNDKILFLNFNKKDNGPCDPILYDTKTNKFLSINPEISTEKVFDNINYEIITDNLAFNAKDNRFNLLKAKNKNLVKDNIIKINDNKRLNISKSQGNYLLYLENTRLKKRYKAIKVDSDLCLGAIEYNDNIVFYDTKNIYLYNPLEGIKLVLYKISKNDYLNQLFIYKENLVIPQFPKVKIINLKIKKIIDYKIITKDIIKVKPLISLLPSGYLFFYNIYSKNSYLFDLKTKKQITISNIVKINNHKKNFPENCNLITSDAITSIKNTNNDYILVGQRIFCNPGDFNPLFSNFLQDLSIRKLTIESNNKSK